MPSVLQAPRALLTVAARVSEAPNTSGKQTALNHGAKPFLMAGRRRIWPDNLPQRWAGAWCHAAAAVMDHERGKRAAILPKTNGEVFFPNSWNTALRKLPTIIMRSIAMPLKRGSNLCCAVTSRVSIQG